MRTALLIAMALITQAATNAAEVKTYYIEGRNINIRQTPGGRVIGQADGPYTFSATEENGWVEFRFNGRIGYVSKSTLQEIRTADFSSAFLGEYMGNDRAFNGDGYSIGTLSNIDGYVVFNFTDYSPAGPDGLRNMMDYHLVGLPENGIVRFTHSLSGFDESIPVARQLEGNEMPQTQELIADKEGNLYMGRRTYNPQNNGRTVADIPLTERALFDAKGDVKKITLVRAHPDNVISAGESIQDFIHEYYFDHKGNIYAFYVYDINGNGAEKNDYNISGNHVEFTAQAINGCRTTGSYDREITNHAILYNGTAKTTGPDGSVITEGALNSSFDFNMNGQPVFRGFSEFSGPFYVSSFCNAAEYSERPVYTRNTLGPTSIDFDYTSGGDGEVYSTTLRYKENDSHGNWTRRDAYCNAKPFFVEKRIIEYY